MIERGSANANKLALATSFLKGDLSNMILVTQNNDTYEIRFPYDPAIIELVKNVPGRAWNPEHKFWSIPLARLGFLVAQFKGTKYEKELKIESQESININASMDEPNKIPDIDISDVTMYVHEGDRVFEHQKDMIKFAKWRYNNGLKSGFILADEMGCGKTLSTMLWAMYMKEHYNAKHCLIVACVNSAKYNWKLDIEKHTNGQEHPYILGSRVKRDGTLDLTRGSKEKYEDLQTMKMYGKKGTEPLPYFLIINIEAIRYKEGKNFPIANRITELINSGEISLVALDEVHRNCFEYDTLIHTDQGLMKIGDIVESHSKSNVLSYDLTTHSFVYKPIIDWHKHSVESQLIELIIEEGDQIRKLTCTPDHEFYTRNRGWVKALGLTESDDIVFNKGESHDN